MDLDINNRNILQAGAFAQRTMNRQDDWRPIDTAPRDGTIIEIRCTYGVAPWYDLHQWLDGRWAKVSDPSFGFSEGPSFSWRPHNGNPAAYVDPTGGMQYSAAYWRGAAAAKHGLPVDHFEKLTARNATDRIAAETPSPKETPRKPGFWGRLFSW